ncbi:MAG: hypothetical protein IPK19_28455 [Chloroflexi bacterium]|nr:hypothetical protein [Chloroflexota bacterium]
MPDFSTISVRALKGADEQCQTAPNQDSMNQASMILKMSSSGFIHPTALKTSRRVKNEVVVPAISGRTVKRRYQ